MLLDSSPINGHTSVLIHILTPPLQRGHVIWSFMICRFSVAARRSIECPRYSRLLLFSVNSIYDRLKKKFAAILIKSFARRRFLALSANHTLFLWVLSGLLCHLRLFWLVRVNTLVLVLRHCITLHWKLLCHYDLVLLTSSCDSHCQLQSRQIFSQTHNFIYFNFSSFLTDENSCKKIRNPGLCNYRTGKQHRRN